MEEQKRQQLVTTFSSFLSYASKYLPDDVYDRLREMRETEDSEMGKIVYDAMFENMDLAAKTNRPSCQDTGIIQFFVKVGTGFPYMDDLEDCLRDAVRKATKETPLRPNCVEVFDERNTGDNIGHHIPWIDWEIVPGRDDIEVYLYMAGGGCSLPGKAAVLMPLEGYEGVVKFVFDQMTSYGINACPPLLVGIGIAGSVEVAAKLSKKALLRPVGSSNENPRGADLEKRIADGLNKIGIGPGGLSGKESVMGVHIEQAGRHPATIAVGVSTACWAHRRAILRVDADLNATMLSHKEAQL